MGKRTEEDEKEFLKWLVEQGSITQEMYEIAVNTTPERRELNNIKAKLNAYPDSETVKKLLERKKELEKIVMEQEK